MKARRPRATLAQASNPRSGVGPSELLVLLAVVVAALFPALVLGWLPAQTYLIDQYAPWLSFPFKGHPVTAGGDSFFAYLPDRLAALHEWSQGKLPLWNPYISAGVPFLGIQTANPLDPLIALHLVLPMGYALGVNYGVLLFLAGFGVVLMLREQGLTSRPALAMGAVCMALNPYFVYWLELRVFVAGFALLPLALWALERIHNRRSAHRETGVLALCTGYAGLGGNLQTLALFLGILGLRILWLTLWGRIPKPPKDGSQPTPPPGVPARLGWSLTALVVGMAIGILPTIASLELLGESTRLAGASAYYTDNNFLSWRAVGLWFSPGMFGWPAHQVNEVLPIFNRSVYSSSGWGAVGILPLGLALLALVKKAAPSSVRIFYGGLAGMVLVVLLAMDSSLYTSLTGFWPGLNTIDLLRTLFVVNLGGAILAAWGTAHLLEAFKGRGRFRGWILPLTIYGAFGLAAVFLARTGVNSSNSLVRDLTPLVCVCVLVFIIGRMIPVSLRGWGLVILAAVSLGRIHVALNSFSKADTAYPERSVVSDLRVHLGPPDYHRFMVLATERAFPSNTASIFQLSDVRGYSSSPTARYRDLIEWTEGRELSNKTYISNPDSQIYRLLGAGYILFPIEAWMNPVLYDTVAVSGPRMTLFKRKDALPRAFLVHDITIVQTKAQMQEALINPLFDPARTAVLENGVQPPRVAPAVRRESVVVSSYESDRVRIRVNASAPGLLVLADVYYPGWKARVDGEPREILPANWGLRGIAVKAGEHEIEFVYRPWWLYPGAFLTVLGLLFAVAAALRKPRLTPASSGG